MPKTAECYCPWCGGKLGAAACTTEKGIDESILPQPGDFSTCAYCGQTLVFQDDLTLRMPTLEELVEMPEDAKRMMEVNQRFIREVNPLGKRVDYDN